MLYNKDKNYEESLKIKMKREEMRMNQPRNKERYLAACKTAKKYAEILNCSSLWSKEVWFGVIGLGTQRAVNKPR
jgi:hypothetical protein